MKKFLVSLCLCAGLYTAPSEAVIYDAAADFSAVNNPNSVWSYGYSLAGGAAYAFTPFDTANNSLTIPVWTSSTYRASGAPAIWKNLTVGMPFGAAPGQLALHPGPNPYSPAILRFTAPTTGTYNFTAMFFQGDRGVMNGAVILNNNDVAPMYYIPSTDLTPSFMASVLLLAGNTLDLAVGNNGNFGSGNTPVSFVLSSNAVPGTVPEPATYLLLLCGLGLIGFIACQPKRA